MSKLGSLRVKEYKVVKYKESYIKAILLGQSKISPNRFTKFLNRYAKDDWSTKSIDKSIDSVCLLFSREIYIVVLERDIDVSKITTLKEEAPLITDEWESIP